MRTKTNEEIILEYIDKTCAKQQRDGQAVGLTTNMIADALDMQRANVSGAVNKLYREGKIDKIKGKPVLYIANAMAVKDKFTTFEDLIGTNHSLKKPIQQAKAAILYPPRGLHTLILGQTGVGKTMFAELMYRFALQNSMLEDGSPFVSFNCADYANNPQLLLSYLFGAKKGSYTGADSDREGLVEKANGGILFLDEVHRLPPEGQEMFFYLMDKGLYKPLGDVGEHKKADVFIICATTENKDSRLLTTFTRRIPMVISLPSLKERTLKERFRLLGEFFKLEASGTNKEIVVTADAVKSLLLYNCIGNIGQLKNDIQLGCANGFLKCIVNEGENINVDLEELPEYVRKGMANYKINKKEVDDIVLDNSIFHFTAKGSEKIVSIDSNPLTNVFYDAIEERISVLKTKDLSQEDINLIMSIDIDKYFKKYIYKMNGNINKEELSKVVDPKIITAVEDFLGTVSKNLKRVFPQRIFYGLCIHISSSIERIKLGKNIENHKIDEIIERYPQEFAQCDYIVKVLEKEFNVVIPKDEIGFITMFITEEFANEQSKEGKPVVVIAMHGNTTASSMADAVNKLIGEESIYAYDMPLDKSTDQAYQELKDHVLSIHQGAGVLILADMGSLTMFGEWISEETGIKIRAIDMVTTLIALEVARKALIGLSIDEIYNEVIHKNIHSITYTNDTMRRFQGLEDNVIVTMCITGEGSAVKIKNLVENQLDLEGKNIQIIPMSVLDREDMLIKIKRIAKDKNILAIVGTLNPELHGIPFVSASELFLNKDFNRLQAIVNTSNYFTKEDFDKREICKNVLDVFSESIQSYDLEVFLEKILEFIDESEKAFKMPLNIESVVGLTMHIACVIERILQDAENTVVFPNKEIYKDKHFEDLLKLNELLKPFYKEFGVKICEDEQLYIYSLVKKM